MSLRLRRHATRDLARIGMVLSPKHARRGLFAGSILLVAALSMGAGSGYFYAMQEPREAPAPATSPLELQQVQRRLDQSRMTLDLAAAHSHELERQIDALNQRLRESQDELTFFRKSGDRKH
ncbi:MAG: hypothetical protein ABIV63_12085 [Caldimonas sp.]